MKLPNGVVRDSSDVYHSKKNIINASAIKAVLRSPMHYRASLTEPNDPTPAMRFGTLVHTALLEPAVFMQSFRISPKFDMRTTKGKEDSAAWNKDLPDGAIIVSTDEADKLTAMIKTLTENKIVPALLSEGVAEHSLYYSRDGVECKARPDYLREDGMVIDLKTTSDASKSGFSRSIVNFGYDVQAAWYLDACTRVFGGKWDTFVFVAVETSPPYAIGVYVADDSVLERGRKRSERALKTLIECREKDIWPGYQTEAENISIPNWAMYD